VKGVSLSPFLLRGIGAKAEFACIFMDEVYCATEWHVNTLSSDYAPNWQILLCSSMRSNAGLDDHEGAVTSNVSLQLRKQEFVRDAIWAVAIDLFAEKGFDETTLDDIVAAAGTSRRTFFRHFESKRDLIAQPIVTMVRH
jgi:hypothetical protein